MADRNGPNQDEDEAPDSWRTFHVILAGRTNGAHESVVRTIKSLGQTEVNSPEDADYCLVFCPVSSRVGTDVSYALEHLKSGKEAVLVVMHHTFNPEQVIPPSSRLVEERRVRLTLDVLFYQDKLLKCEFNDKMKADVQKFFRSSTPEFSQRTDSSGQTAPSQNDAAKLKQDSVLKSKHGTGLFRRNTVPASHHAETSHSLFSGFLSHFLPGTKTQVKTQESQNDVAEQKQDSDPHDESRSNAGSVPPIRSRDPGSLDHQEAPPPQSGRGTDDSIKTEASKRREQDDLSTETKNKIERMEEEIATMKQQHEKENLKKDMKIKKLQNDVAELQRQLVVKSGLEDDDVSDDVPASADSRGSSGSSFHRSDGTSGSIEASRTLQQVDSSHDRLKKEMTTMKQQHQRVVDELRREIVIKDEEIKKLQNEVAELKQHIGPPVMTNPGQSQSNTGSGPPDSGGESGSQDQQGTSSPQSEEGTNGGSSNMEQIDSSWTEDDNESFRRPKKRKQSRSQGEEVKDLKVKILKQDSGLVCSQSNTGPGEPDSAAGPGSSDQQGAPPPPSEEDSLT